MQDQRLIPETQVRSGLHRGVVCECLQGNQPHRFPPRLASTNHIRGVGAEDEGVTVAIGQVIGVGGGPVDVGTAQMRRNGEKSGPPLKADG